MGEELFVAVNDDKIDLKSALNYLRGLNDGVLEGLVQMIVGRQYALANGIQVTDDELQKAVDEYRYLTGLESAEAFNQSLKDRKINLLSFQCAMENLLLKGKVTNTVPDDEVDAYIAENQLSMEQTELYNIRLEDEDTAQEIKSLLDEEENFLALAHEHSKDENTAMKGGYVGKLYRNEMTAEIEAAVFSSAVGDVIGPIKTEQGYNLFKVASFIKPDKNDPALRASVKQVITGQKMAEMTARAKVECSLYEA